MTSANILVFAGSSRRASLNKALAKLAARQLQRLGGEATFVDLADYPMPLYNGDLEAEQGLPDNTRKLRTLLAKHDALLVVSPEYNGFITPLLKNTLDWLSRPEGGVNGLSLFANKTALVLSASPGALGGLRSLGLIRQLLTNMGVIVLPQQFALGKAGTAFDEQGELTDSGHRQKLDELCQTLIEQANKLV